jgi:hypothetical protein
MAEKNFKVGESIEVQYQAGNGESGLTIRMEILKPDKSKVSGGPFNLTEIGNSGRYFGSFVPDVIGEWSVQLERADGTGKGVKTFSVGDYHIDDLGNRITLMAGKLDDQDTNLGVMHTKVDVVKANTDRISVIESDVAAIKGALHSPVMVA